MDKKLWRQKYAALPPLPCPRCGVSKFTRKGEIQYEEPAHVTRDLEDCGLIGEMSEGVFTGFMVCRSSWCGEVAAVSGRYRSDDHTMWDERTQQDERLTSHSYEIISFVPAPRIIDVPKGLNADAKRHLTKAFELFWNDHASCANRLRIVVEYLLDQFGIDRETKGGGFRPLHERITELAKKRPEQEEFLNALRWLGNAGSHSGGVDFDDLLHCLEMLENVMVELLEDRRAKMSAEAKRIIAAQGKPTR